MKKNIPSLRSPLARVRSLGPAGHGTEHWWKQRVTALALIPLMLLVLNGFFTNVVFGNFETANYWLHSPFSALFVILFLGVGFHHAASGLQVVIEDYIHCECAKLTSIIIVKFLCVAFAVFGILATTKILFGV